MQITFSLLIVLQTWLSPAQGWLVERFGAADAGRGRRRADRAWAGFSSAQVTSLTGLYLTYGLFCGVGTGIVYIGIVGLMVRWFPDRRGFAIGMVAAGYGMGALLTTFPIDTMIKSSGYQSTLITFGIILGVVGVAAALGLRAPQPGEVTATPAQVLVSGRDTEPSAMLKTPIFWLMFAMMTMMSTGGLMVTSNFANFAREFGVADLAVLGMAAVPLALTVDRVTQRPDAAILRLGVRPHRPREHDGDRIPAGSAGDHAAAGVPLQRRRRSSSCRGWCSSAGARFFRCSPRP